MNVKPVSAQIDSSSAGGELKALAGDGQLGSPSHESGFAMIFQALSGKSQGSRETKPRTAQAELGDKPSNTKRVLHEVPSRKGEGSRPTKPRESQAEIQDKPSSKAPDMHRSLSRKAEANKAADSRPAQSENEAQPSGLVQTDQQAVSRKAEGSGDAEPATQQGKADDGDSRVTSDGAETASQETSSGTDTESLAAQAETGAALVTTAPGADPLLMSLLGAAMQQQAPQALPAQPVAETDDAANSIEGISDSLGQSAMPSTAQLIEGAMSPLGQEIEPQNIASLQTATTTEDVAASWSAPVDEGQARPDETEVSAPVAVNSDLTQPLVAGQGEEVQVGALQQGPVILDQPEKALTQAAAAAASAQAAVQPAAVATVQQANQNGEVAAAQPDRSQEQQVLGKAEPSLHQRNMQTESPTAQTAAAVSAQAQGEGQGFQNATDGQKKDEGLKWLSRVDLQSAEVSPRQSQQPEGKALDSGPQNLSIALGQGGTPSTSKSASAPAAPPASQVSRLSPEPETAPVPGSHSVQFDLAPSDFGQLRVRVVLSDQTIHTHMSTDRAELGQMLTNQQDQLSTQLSSAGLDLGRFQVQVDQGRTGQSGQEWQSQAQGGRSQEQRESRQQDQQEESPGPAKATRTGALSLFA